jgi:glycerol uptake operon antiterminator
MKLNQTIIPSISNFKTLKIFLESSLEYCIIVNFQLAEIHYIIEEIKKHHKKVLVHIDMIKGLSPDEFGATHLIQNLKVDGLISIKPKVIEVANKKNIISIQRIFLKDSLSFKRSLDLVKRTNPMYVEVLPAISGELIIEIKNYLEKDIYCGGLLSSKEQIKDCLDSGASGVTVSNSDLWDIQKDA